MFLLCLYTFWFKLVLQPLCLLRLQYSEIKTYKFTLCLLSPTFFLSVCDVLNVTLERFFFLDSKYTNRRVWICRLLRGVYFISPLTREPGKGNYVSSHEETKRLRILKRLCDHVFDALVTFDLCLTDSC